VISRPPVPEQFLETSLRNPSSWCLLNLSAFPARVPFKPHAVEIIQSRTRSFLDPPSKPTTIAFPFSCAQAQAAFNRQCPVVPAFAATRHAFLEWRVMLSSCNQMPAMILHSTASSPRISSGADPESSPLDLISSGTSAPGASLTAAGARINELQPSLQFL